MFRYGIKHHHRRGNEGKTAYTSNKEITAAYSNGAVTVTLPNAISGIRLLAATYNADDQMTDYKFGEYIEQTATIPIVGDHIRLFFLAETYLPHFPVLTVN